MIDPFPPYVYFVTALALVMIALLGISLVRDALVGHLPHREGGAGLVGRTVAFPQGKIVRVIEYSGSFRKIGPIYKVQVTLHDGTSITTFMARAFLEDHVVGDLPK